MYLASSRWLSSLLGAAASVTRKPKEGTRWTRTAAATGSGHRPAASPRTRR
jgi:hypothetical protein